MTTSERKRRRRTPAAATEAPQQRRPVQEPEHDQDSDPPRTARAPGASEIDEAWGRQEYC